MIQPIKDDGVRPTGDPNKCFYCGQPKGESHEKDCVIPERSVVVEMTIKYVTTVPESWTTHDIEFYLNKSSHCSGNEVQKIAEQVLESDFCTCARTAFKFVREATEEDEVEMAFKPEVDNG